MTSIEWLEEKLIDNGVNFLSEEFEFIKQAKEMHEKEAFEFWNGGINSTEEGGKSFEQYYNEKFKKLTI